MINTKIAGKYSLKKKIGSGSFGEIFLSVTSNGEEFAVKLEKLSSRHPQLIYESRLLKTLQGSVGVPKVNWAGIEGNYAIMVLELLGPSLEDLFNFCNRRFSLKSVLMLADQMISRVEYIHSKGFIHRDIKPENFLIGLGKKSSLLYLIDFGLAKKFRDLKSFKHIDYKEGKHLTGTARYASINTHQGIEQSRRDDLETIGYLFVYFFKGGLPWQGLPAKNKEQKYKNIKEKKISFSVDELCRACPEEFKTYLLYCRGLKFEEKPDYSYLRRILKDLFVAEGFEFDHIYDWTLQNYTQARKPKKIEEEKKIEASPVIRQSSLRPEKKKKSKNCSIF